MAMERYLYFCLSSSFVLAVVVVYLLRRDLSPVILSTGLFGCIWGPVAEYWYFKDYWRPQSLLATPILEDALFGFGVAALGACSYKLWFGRGVDTAMLHRTHYALPVVFMVAYVLAMLLFNIVIGVNSILVASLLFISLACWIARERKDLTVPALLSGVIMAAYSLVVYGVGLNFVVNGEEELSRIWLVKGTWYGTTILGNVPLTEVVWFFAWGCLSGVCFEYSTGRGLQRRK
jgi:hypothetical protein